MIIRIVKDDNGADLIFKVADTKQGNDMDTIIMEKTVHLSDRDWKTFSGSFNKSGFRDMNNQVLELGFDGAQWILEVATPAGYNVVCRRSPDKGEYYDLCLLMIHLSGYRFKKSEIY